MVPAENVFWRKNRGVRLGLGWDDKWLISCNYCCVEESAGCDCSIGNVLFSKLAQLCSASHEQHVSKFNSWISDEFIVIYKFLFVLIHYQLYEKSIRIQTVPASVLQSPQDQVAAVGPVWRPGRWFMSPITCKLSNWHLNTFNSRLDINQVKPANLRHHLLDLGRDDRFLITTYIILLVLTSWVRVLV